MAGSRLSSEIPPNGERSVGITRRKSANVQVARDPVGIRKLHPISKPLPK
jgi:hypothetical protein